MRRVYGIWENHPSADFIPAIGVTPVEHPDAFDIQRAPASIRTPTGPPTANFVRETGTVVIEFNEHHVNPEFIRRSVNRFATEYGADSVKAIEVLIADNVMASDGGVWLVVNKYDRVIIANEKTGLYRFRKAVKLRKKNPTTEKGGA
jgi:hypothetical protein